MLKTTFISRASDGLILCETYDTVTDSQGMTFCDKGHSNLNEFSWNAEVKCEITAEEDGKARLLMHC